MFEVAGYGEGRQRKWNRNAGQAEEEPKLEKPAEVREERDKGCATGGAAAGGKLAAI